MDFTGRMLKTPNGPLALRDRTIDFDDAWSRFPNWNPKGAYGYELDLLQGEFKRNPWLHAFMLDNEFREVGYRTKLYTYDMWAMYETRQPDLRLKDLLTYVDLFVLKYHIDNTGVLIGKHRGILWVEELDHNGQWESIGEMFAF